MLIVDPFTPDAEQTDGVVLEKVTAFPDAPPDAATVKVFVLKYRASKVANESAWEILFMVWVKVPLTEDE
jgi:hypothetical protein